jgi:ATP-dependent helicase HrpB
VYLAAPLTQRDVEELFTDEIVREELVAYDAQQDLIRAVRRRTLGALVLEERALHAPDPALIGAAWIPVIRAAGLASLPWSDAASALRSRVRFARTLDAQWPDWSDATLLASIERWLAPSLAGVMRRAALDRVDLVAALRTQLDWKQLVELDRLAPTHVEVPTGSRIAVDYSEPEAPVLAVRLQELFGASETPHVGGGRVPLTLHLLSPAHRPVQVTRDLAGFWAGSYVAVRKDLRGRYPRHSWPEDPLQAEPTRRAKPR